MKTYDIFLDVLPKLDLHGFDTLSAKVAVNDFVLENSILKKEEILIIHGIGEGLVKKAVHEALSKNKLVASYKIANNNIGCTVVYLKNHK